MLLLQLLTELDGVEVRKDVYIIAATNRLELIDDAMLRPGRLGKLLYVPLPSASDRASILRAVTRYAQLQERSLLKYYRNVSLDTNCVNLDAIGIDARADGTFHFEMLVNLCRLQWSGPGFFGARGGLSSLK